MTIKEILGLPEHTQVALKAMISNKVVGTKLDGNKYITLTLTDKTGTIDMPVWDNVEQCDKAVFIGTILTISASRKNFGEVKQLKYISSFIEEGESRFDYIASYDVIPEHHEKFFEIMRDIKDLRYHALIEKMIGVTCSTDETQQIVGDGKWGDFYFKPSAEKHHGAKVHGLFLHTLGVMTAAKNMIENYKSNPLYSEATDEKLDADLLLFTAITHDVDKTKEYDYFPTIKRRDVILGHEVTYVHTLMQAVEDVCMESYVKFTEEEIHKIVFIVLGHHGQWAKYKDDRNKMPLEGTLLHLCDMIDSQIIGAIEN